jgi:hypothetical protein
LKNNCFAISFAVFIGFIMRYFMVHSPMVRLNHEISRRETRGYRHLPLFFTGGSSSNLVMSGKSRL